MATYVLWRQLLQILHNMASNGLVWLVVGNCNKLWSRISSLNDFVYFEAEVRNLGLRYQTMAGMTEALWGKIDQILRKVAYNGPIYVLVAG